ncbi:hypothetical protein BJX99DRAFT_228921 [Aspergillus californicus]
MPATVCWVGWLRVRSTAYLIPSASVNQTAKIKRSSSIHNGSRGPPARHWTADTGQEIEQAWMAWILSGLRRRA